MEKLTLLTRARVAHQTRFRTSKRQWSYYIISSGPRTKGKKKKKRHVPGRMRVRQVGAGSSDDGAPPQVGRRKKKNNVKPFGIQTRHSKPNVDGERERNTNNNKYVSYRRDYLRSGPSRCTDDPGRGSASLLCKEKNGEQVFRRRRLCRRGATAAAAAIKRKEK